MGFLTDTYAIFIVRWFHILSGIMWIGLLWYFNFVQIPNMSKIPDEQKPAIGKVIAPSALFWFRWGAAFTVLWGLVQAWQLGWIGSALVLGLDGSGARMTMIGFGMWMGIIMAFNVWFIIWPNQQKALGMVEADDASKPAAARIAMLFSRTNTMLSIPMSYAMVAGPHLM